MPALAPFNLAADLWSIVRPRTSFQKGLEAIRTAAGDLRNLGDAALKSAAAELRSLDRIPHLTGRPSSDCAHGLSHREAFILGLVDGAATMRAIVHASSLPAAQVLCVLVELLRDGDITLD